MCPSIEPLFKSADWNASRTQSEFMETIRVEHERVWNLDSHNERMNRTRRAFWGEAVGDLNLTDWIEPTGYRDRTRCRVVYGENVIKVEYFPYTMRSIHHLQLVSCDEAEYQYKRTDRSQLNRLFDLRGNADEVLIVRNGYLTDTTIANLALWDGTSWYTPATPLLRGTQRHSLLKEGVIIERELRVEDLANYQRIRLFNAMISFGEIELDTAAILR